MQIWGSMGMGTRMSVSMKVCQINAMSTSIGRMVRHSQMKKHSLEHKYEHGLAIQDGSALPSCD